MSQHACGLFRKPVFSHRHGSSFAQQSPFPQPIRQQGRPNSQGWIFQSKSYPVWTSLENVHFGGDTRVAQSEIELNRILRRDHRVRCRAQQKSWRGLWSYVQLVRELLAQLGGGVLSEPGCDGAFMSAWRAHCNHRIAEEYKSPD